MSEETLPVLRRIPLFRGQSPEVLEAIRVRLVPRQAAAGTSLLRKGEQARAIYILVQGEVAIF